MMIEAAILIFTALLCLFLGYMIGFMVGWVKAYEKAYKEAADEIDKMYTLHELTKDIYVN